MSTGSKGHLRGRFWKGALLLLVVLPLLPEIVILAATLFAAVIGCHVASETACAVGPSSVGDIIRVALEAGSLVGSKFGDGWVVAWVALCYVLIVQGWARLSRRLLLGLVVSLIFAFLPYFGPILSIEHLANPKCLPNEGAIGPCTMYGGNIGSVAHDAVRLGWRTIDGAPIAFGTFLAFLTFAVGAYLIGRRSAAPHVRDEKRSSA
jgi:hypothetical protein